MDAYIKNQLDIEICASMALARYNQISKVEERFQLHRTRVEFKQWLNEMPRVLASGERTVPSSTAMTASRIACLTFALEIAEKAQPLEKVIEEANLHFLRNYQPLMARLSMADKLFDAPIVILRQQAPSSKSATKPTSADFTHSIHHFSQSTPDKDDDQLLATI